MEFKTYTQVFKLNFHTLCLLINFVSLCGYYLLEIVVVYGCYSYIFFLKFNDMLEDLKRYIKNKTFGFDIAQVIVLNLVVLIVVDWVY